MITCYFLFVYRLGLNKTLGPSISKLVLVRGIIRNVVGGECLIELLLGLERLFTFEG